MAISDVGDCGLPLKIFYFISAPGSKCHIKHQFIAETGSRQELFSFGPAEEYLLICPEW